MNHQNILDGKNHSNPFSEIATLEFYDGFVDGAVRMASGGSPFIAFLCAFDISKNIRIFTLVETTEPVFAAIRTVNSNTYLQTKDLIIREIQQNQQDGYLFRASGIESVTFDLEVIPRSAIKYFGSMEEILDQDQQVFEEYFQRQRLP